MSNGGRGVVDLRATDEWRRLADRFEPLRDRHLRDLFAEDPDAGSTMTVDGRRPVPRLLQAPGRPTRRLAALMAVARRAGVEERRDAMFAGAAHQHHRGPGRAPRGPAHARGAHARGGRTGRGGRRAPGARPDGRGGHRIRSGEWTGATGRRIRAVVNIGIGGSDLGPAMAHEALVTTPTRDRLPVRVQHRPGRPLRQDPDLDPAETLFVVSSKTFTTLETLTNAACGPHGCSTGSGRGTRRWPSTSWPCPPTRPAVTEFGIDPANMFGFWDWVGGRYSYDSAIGFSLMVAIGPDGVRRHAGRLPRHRRALRHDAPRGQHAGHPGHAQRLVHQPLRRRDPRRAALQSAPGPLPRLPAAAHHGVQRQVGAPRRVTGRGARPARSSGGSRAPTASTPSTS